MNVIQSRSSDTENIYTRNGHIKWISHNSDVNIVRKRAKTKRARMKKTLYLKNAIFALAVIHSIGARVR